jgi:hypothetical protein
MSKAMRLNPELFDSEKYDENLIKESAECLLEAEEIKKDPVLMKNIKKFWEKEIGKIGSLSDLKLKASNASNKDFVTPKEKKDKTIGMAIQILFNGDSKELESGDDAQE